MHCCVSASGSSGCCTGIFLFHREISRLCLKQKSQFTVESTRRWCSQPPPHPHILPRSLISKLGGVLQTDRHPGHWLTNGNPFNFYCVHLEMQSLLLAPTSHHQLSVNKWPLSLCRCNDTTAIYASNCKHSHIYACCVFFNPSSSPEDEDSFIFFYVYFFRLPPWKRNNTPVNLAFSTLMEYCQLKRDGIISSSRTRPRW